jgi:hypothetical protein
MATHRIDVVSGQVVRLVPHRNHSHARAAAEEGGEITGAVPIAMKHDDVGEPQIGRQLAEEVLQGVEASSGPHSTHWSTRGDWENDFAHREACQCADSITPAELSSEVIALDQHVTDFTGEDVGQAWLRQEPIAPRVVRLPIHRRTSMRGEHDDADVSCPRVIAKPSRELQARMAAQRHIGDDDVRVQLDVVKRVPHGVEHVFALTGRVRRGGHDIPPDYWLE